MDQNIENLFLKTSMEIYLRSKLREQERLNADLKEQIAAGIKVTPDDVSRMIKIEQIVTRTVTEAQTQDTIHGAMLELAGLIRNNG